MLLLRVLDCGKTNVEVATDPLIADAGYAEASHELAYSLARATGLRVSCRSPTLVEPRELAERGF